MTLSFVKLLEFIAIKKTPQKALLKVRLFFEKEIDTYIEIDEFTSKNITAIIEDDKDYKYRISFSSNFDVNKQEYISSLTRTYIDRSDKIYFACSKEYINNIKSIKEIQHLDDLYNLDCVLPSLESGDEVTKSLKFENESNKLTKDIELENKISKPFRFALIGFSLIFIMLFVYLITNLLDQNVINEKVLADSIHFDSELNSDQDIDLLDKHEIILQNEHLGIEDTLLASNICSNESILPFIELDDGITYNIPKGYVALTFDDGPSLYSKEITDILDEYKVGGTFFLLGRNIKKYPENIEYVHSKGYSIGSHSSSHQNMVKQSYKRQESEVLGSIELIEEITNERVTLFRPPYGSFNEKLKNILHENNCKMTLWNNDPEDWKGQNPDKILNHIQNTEVSGSIILLHESHAVTKALPRIIEYLQEMKLEIVNLK